ncbi:MAG: polyprenyl synthetase family protein [Oscillospiraceae bacterium]
MSRYDFECSLYEYVMMIEAALERYIPKDTSPESAVVDAMRYSLLSGGKRLRGAILLETCSISGGSVKTALPFAAAIEMVHAYSLIHDDLPCMDDDDLRRGKPSCHKVFGEATALLAGDALLTKAFSLIMDCDAKAEVKVKAASLLAHSIGEHGMIGGQVLDMQNEKTVPNTQLLERTYLLKTAYLIKASAAIGGIIADLDEKNIEIIGNYAVNVGLAFQIFDDILDVIGEQNKLGKPIGSDAQNDKTTYATIFSVELATELALEHIAKAKEYLSSINIYSGWLYDFADMVANRDR